MAVRVLAFNPPGAPLDAPTALPHDDGLEADYLPLALGLVLDCVGRAAPAGAYRLDHPFVSAPDELADAIEREGPALCLFSNYVWSVDANLAASDLAKRADARCLTIHGGPSAPKYPAAAREFLARHPHVDVLVRGEGEATVAELAARLAGALERPRRAREAALREVQGITFIAEDGELVRTPDRPLLADLDGLGSPYLNGLFDRLLADRHPGHPLVAVQHATLETNRGCPYGCAFCDWGSATLQEVRRFGIERVRAELEWIARHRTRDLFISDANFGMLPRDVDIARAMADVRSAYGYPKQINANYAKNGPRRLPEIFRIWKNAGFVFEPVIAIQSMDRSTLVALNRSNIKSDRYLELSDAFRKLRLPVRVHLMLGLPGQTVASWMNDLELCFKRQEDVQLFLTRLLPNSPMADPEYVARHSICTDDSEMVVATTTFTKADHDLMHRIGCAFLLYNNWAILRYLLMYLEWDHDIRAVDFIRDHVEAVRAHPDTNPEAALLLGPMLAMPPLRVTEEPPVHLQRFQRTGWGAFYAEVAAFLARRYGVAGGGALEAMLLAQEAVMPRAGASSRRRFDLQHDVSLYVKRGLEAMRAGRSPAARLEDFAAGELVVTDPLGSNRPVPLEWGTSLGGPDPRWQLASTLDPRVATGDLECADPPAGAPPRRFPEVLYVHPSGHLNDLVVPAGALSCMNATRATKLGRYAFEVADEEIANARVVAIDVHWALALPGLERLVEHVRKIRPDVPIVVGGITAGHYADTLLQRYAIDYVVRGDSEVAFARLVDALLSGCPPTGIPNVHGRNIPSVPALRMTPAEFDATDCVTCDWFPTYANVTNWDAVAFGPGRTIGVARGCPKRCPECYGSYASTFGDGYLLRSPVGVAGLLRQAEGEGARNVRLVVGKPPPRQLAALLRGIAEGGPYAFDGEVGFYLCTAPEPDDLARLEAAFQGKVTLSLVRPEEHQPALSPQQLVREKEAWRRVATHAAGSKALQIDVWSVRSSNVLQVKGEIADPDNERVKASYGAVWAVTRPLGDKSVAFDDVVDAVAPVWTFYAARLLSPALATMLAPFRFLDEIETDPLAAAAPEGALAAYHALVADRWRATRLATLPGLRFAVLPARARATAAQIREGVHVSGALEFATKDEMEILGEASALEEHADHRGIELRARLSSLPVNTDVLAIVPQALDGSPVDSAWLDAVGAPGVLVVRPGSAGFAARELVVHIRVQDARVFVLDGHREEIARGVAHLGYFRPVSRRRGRPDRKRQATSPARSR